MCNRAVEKKPSKLKYVPERYKTQNMCNKAVDKEPLMLKYVPDYFITEKMLVNPVCKEFCEEFCEEIKKRKNLKKEIYLELLPIAWHPDRFWNWSLDNDEKKRIEKIMVVNEKVFKKGEYSGVE